MTNNQINIEKLLNQSRTDIMVPSRAEFGSLINHVTNESLNRNTQQKGILSPFITIMNFTKNKLIIAGSVALLAIIIIVPTVRHQRMVAPNEPMVTQQESDVSFDKQSAEVIQESKGIVSEDFVADMMNEFSAEDAITAQELADDGALDNSYDIDSAIIS